MLKAPPGEWVYNTLSPGAPRLLAVSYADRLKEFSSSKAFEMKWLRQVLRVSWIARKINEWVSKRATVTSYHKPFVISENKEAAT